MLCLSVVRADLCGLFLDVCLVLVAGFFVCVSVFGFVSCVSYFVSFFCLCFWLSVLVGAVFCLICVCDLFCILFCAMRGLCTCVSFLFDFLCFPLLGFSAG